MKNSTIIIILVVVGVLVAWFLYSRSSMAASDGDYVEGLRYRSDLRRYPRG